MSVTIVQLPPITRRPKTTLTTTPGSFGGIRIVDMPDLGGVDDTSSMVGERAGSGRFAATALRDYTRAGMAAYVPTIAALRALATGAAAVIVQGYYTPGDGGGGIYSRTTTAGTDNGGTIINSANGTYRLDTFGQRLTIRQFGAKGDGVADDTAAIRAAIAYLNAVGGTLCFPAGNYVVSGSGLLIDRSTMDADDSLTHVSWLGEGKGNTQITYVGTGNLFTYTGNVSAGGVGLEGYFTIEGIRFQGSGVTSSCGLHITAASFFVLRDLIVQDFGDGIIGLDVIDAQLKGVLVNVCQQGMTLSFQSFTSPNAIVIQQCNFLACANWGANIADPTTVTWVGGSVEECGISGSNTSRFGIFINAGVAVGGNNGALSATFLGVYFEGNADTADIWFSSGANAGGAAGLLIEGCTFNRVDSSVGQFVLNNILFNQAAAWQSTLTVIGCGFRGFVGYTPSSGRAYISIASASFDWTFTEFGNAWGSTIEIPAISAPTSVPAALSTAWCRFDGTLTGTNPPTQGFNVASVQRTGTGTYVITFGEPFATTGYSVTGSVNGNGAVSLSSDNFGHVVIGTVNFSGALTDFSAVSVQIFGSGPS